MQTYLKFFLKFYKCLFAQQTVEHLGHIISFDGFAPNHNKIEDMMNWPVPNSINNTRILRIN